MNTLKLAMVAMIALIAGEASARVEFRGCQGVTQDSRKVMFDADRLVTYQSNAMNGPGRIQTYSAKNSKKFLQPTMIYEGVDSLDNEVHRQTLTEVRSKATVTVDAGKCPGGGHYKTRTTKFAKLYTIQDSTDRVGWQSYKLNVKCMTDDYISVCDPCREPGADPETCGE